ncbi:LysE family translocator [Methylobacterium sp. WSM2598]|uniref:LysE family translocator n=1 Tax=Methylobacterium sp. WSM2598 TaxID=398261 RepID=UPI0003660D5F|nr:LysE family translocator [Methylobacterium sp. WSM2598]
MDVSTLAAFAVAFTAFAASPGPDNIAIVARTVSHGARSGLAYGAGMVAGILTVLLLSALGLSALAARMESAMTVLRYAGAASLVLAGIRLWSAPAAAPGAGPAPGRRGVASAFAAGLALNLGNPKMPLFSLALLPNVVGTSLTLRETGLLAAIIVAVEIGVVGAYILSARRARALLREPRALRRANRAAGGLMIGAGLAAATAR